MRFSARTSATAAALFVCLSGCDHSSTQPMVAGEGDANAASFTATSTGADPVAFSGKALGLYADSGYAETAGTQHLVSPVWNIAMNAGGVGGRNLTLNLIGELAIGTYTMRIAGTALTHPQFLGMYLAPNADGTVNHYWIDSGTVTIADTIPLVRGTFRVHSSSVALFPAIPTVGTPVPGKPTSLDVSGSFQSLRCGTLGSVIQCVQTTTP